MLLIYVESWVSYLINLFYGITSITKKKTVKKTWEFDNYFSYFIFVSNYLSIFSTFIDKSLLLWIKLYKVSLDNKKEFLIFLCEIFMLQGHFEEKEMRSSRPRLTTSDFQVQDQEHKQELPKWDWVHKAWGFKRRGDAILPRKGIG